MKGGARVLAFTVSVLAAAGFAALVIGPATAWVPPRPPTSPEASPAQGPNLTMNITVSPVVIEAGFSTLAMCNGSGGVGPYNAWLNYTGPSGSDGFWTSGLAGFGLGPSLYEPGNVTFTCTVVDNTGARASASATVRVLPPPSVPLRSSGTSIREGEALTLTASAQGGVAPYRYLWLNLPPGCPYGNVSSVTCTPTAAGSYTVVVGVLDAWGVYNATALTITVLANPGFLGLPPGPAALVLGILGLAAAVGVGLLVLRWRSRRERGARGAPGPEPEAGAQPGVGTAVAGGGTRLPSWAERWDALPRSRRQRIVSTAELLAFSGAFYAAIAALASYTPGLAPDGLDLLVWVLGILVIYLAAKALGPWAPLAALAGGVALYYAAAQPLSSCTSDPGTAAALGVPACGALANAAWTAGLVLAAVAVAAGAYLIRWSRAPRTEKGLIALGAIVLGAMVAGSAVALMTPPQVPPGAGVAVLPFPLPAGSAFAVPFWVSDPSGRFPFSPYTQTFAAVALAGSAPAVLVGGWSSSASVCVYVGNVNYGYLLPPPMKSFGTCGTNVTFAFHLAPATWAIQFSPENPASYVAAVTITRSIELVY